MGPARAGSPAVPARAFVRCRRRRSGLVVERFVDVVAERETEFGRLSD